MLLSLAIDFRSFEEAVDAGGQSLKNCLRLVRTILRHGVVLTDGKTRAVDDSFYHALKHCSEHASKAGKLAILLTELKKAWKTHTVGLLWETASPPNNLNDAAALLNAIAEEGKPDVCVCTDSTREEQGTVPGATHTFSMREAHASDLWEMLSSWGDLEPLDKLSRKTVEQHFGRALKFARTVRIYDQYAGRTDRCPDYREGLLFLSDCWKAHSYFGNNGSLNIEVHTLAPPVHEGSSQPDRSAIATVQREVVDWLEAKKVKVTYHFHQLGTSDFHARHLEAGPCVALIERGFDLFKSSGGLKRNFLKPGGLGDRVHIEEMRRRPCVE